MREESQREAEEYIASRTNAFMSDLGHFRTSCHAFHESVMRFKADIGQALSRIGIYEYTPRPSGWADVE